MTFWETVARGEYIMIALAVLVIIVLWIWIYKGSKIAKPSKREQSLLISKVKDYVAEGDIDNAVSICHDSDTPLGEVMACGLTLVGHPMEEIFHAMQRETEIQKQLYLPGIHWLKYIAVVAPLLGAIGTLIGICDGFRDIANDEFIADLNIIAGSVAPTIPTIVAGLGVGILALVAMACLDSEITHATNRLNEAQKDITEILNEPV